MIRNALRTRRLVAPANGLARYTHSRPKQVEALGQLYETDNMTTVTPTILSHLERRLHQVPHHPINIIKQRIVSHFHSTYTSRTGNAIFAAFDDVSPIVTVEQNFDSLLIPNHHPAKSKIDNYFINSKYILRSHTSAHERDFMRMGFDSYLLTGDVYRRDEIDSSHYPVFYQMEGVRLFTDEELFGPACKDGDVSLFELTNFEETSERQSTHTFDAAKMMELNLKACLTGLVKHLFGEGIETRWVPTYFPFTHPSYELEIKFRGEWLEVLGSGILRQEILHSSGVGYKIGWAFGLGLDRLAMLLFQIPDIRILWSHDDRFIQQFAAVGVDPATNITFKPFSKYPACYKDISFWLNSSYAANDFYEIVRSVGGDLVEEVKLIDEYKDSSMNKTSHCYRILYRSMDKTFTNEEINVIHSQVADSVVKELMVTLR